MNLILLAKDEISKSNTVTLQDRRSEHIIKILRLSPGDTVRVGIINGPTGIGRIIEAVPPIVRLQINANGPMPAAPPLDLILALPRPIMLKRVLSQIAALGVGKLFLINANRVEKSFFSASLFKDNTIQNQFLHGLEQAMDTRVPEVSIHKKFRPFVEDMLAKIIKEYSCKLLAHPNASKFIFQITPNPATGRVLLAIGPEGGWVDFELQKFKEQGFSDFTLGPRILRVDTAVPALLSQISLLRQQFDYQ